MASESKASALEGDAAFMDLYSRQIGAFGIETMAKLVTLRVIVVGLKGVGMEAAKNLALAGPAAITLVDPDEVQMKHLGANFFLRKGDVGKKIGATVVAKLQELNKGVRLTAVDELSEELVAEHDCVLFTEGKKSELIRWNNFCRSNSIRVKDARGGEITQPKPIAFIACLTYGVAGCIFTDFGNDFTVRDGNGEAPVTRVVTNISCEKEGVVTLLPQHEGGKLHGLDQSEHDGWVEFSEVQGMFAKDEATHKSLGLNINESGSWRIGHTKKTIRRKGKEVKVFDGFRVKVGDTSDLSPYMGGGTMTQVKKPFTMHFRSLSANLIQPVSPGDWGLLFTDGAKFGRGEQLHFAFAAIMEFQEESKDGELPRVGNEDDAEDCVKRAVALNDACKTINKMCGEGTALALEEIDADVVRKVAMYAGAAVQPVGCFFGGVVAQEIVKLTGKFTPLKQWVHMDFLEVLPDTKPTDTAPVGGRYDDLISIWGSGFQEKVANARTFMVGCGALGCEFLKNFALLGVGTGPDGLITTTDNDRIEVSNLNRQFLFREHNVGQAKSVASAVAATDMNPDMHVDAKEILVEPKTEATFNDKFWRSLNFVTNALDNVKARQYVDRRCVFFEKALLESGTLGTKCNSLVVVPHLTQSYNDGPADGGDDDAIPMCTLRNFPSLIEHCIEWARAQFTDMFVEPATAAMNFQADPAAFLDKIAKDVGPKGGSKRPSKIASALPTLRGVKRMMEAADGATMDKCIRLASDLFHDMFRNKILNLVANFPKDHKTKDGEPFWTGAKRFPTAASLDLDDANHMAFIVSTANILAVNLGLVKPPPYLVPSTDEKRNPAHVRKVLGGFKPPAFKRSNSAVATHEDEEDTADEAEEAEYETLLAELRATDVTHIGRIEPADFEKDQDLNFHIDFIASASNLRAANYTIPQASRHKCKMIAGKIIPAIATTTAAVTGLVMIEMLKVLQEKKLEDFKCSSNNLGTNAFLFSEPLPPSKAKKEYSVVEMCDVTPLPDGFTKWDKTLIAKGDLTIGEFLKAFKEQTTVNCEMLFHDKATQKDSDVTGKFIIPGAKKKDMDTKLREYAVSLYGEDILGEGQTAIPFHVSCEDDEENCVSVPQVVFQFAD